MMKPALLFAVAFGLGLSQAHASSFSSATVMTYLERSAGGRDAGGDFMGGRAAALHGLSAATLRGESFLGMAASARELGAVSPSSALGGAGGLRTVGFIPAAYADQGAAVMTGAMRLDGTAPRPRGADQPWLLVAGLGLIAFIVRRRVALRE